MAKRASQHTQLLLLTPSLFLSLFLLLTPLVAAFQVSPAAKSLTTGEETIPSAYTLRVLNDQLQELSVNLSVEGSLAPLLTLSPQNFTMRAGEYERLVSISIHPGKLLPGPNLARIRVSATPATDGQFGGGVTLVHKLILFSLYSGSYLEPTFTASDALLGGQAHLLLSFSNYGQERTLAKATVAIRSLGGEELAVVDLGTATVEGGSEGKIEGSWQTGEMPAGRYLAQAMLRYTDKGDVKTVVRDDDVRVGAPNIVFGKLVANFTAGQIAGVRVPVTLVWNEQVESATTFILVNMTGSELFRMTTGRTVFSPGETGGVRGFIEIPDVPAGNYTLRALAESPSAGVLGERSWLVPIAAAPFGVAQVFERAASALPLFIVVVLILLLLVALVLNARRLRKKRR